MIRRAQPTDECINRRRHTLYVVLKLVVLAILIIVLLLTFNQRPILVERSAPTVIIEAPTLEDVPVELLAGPSLALGGRGATGATVILRADGEPLARTQVDAAGRWSVTGSFEPGEHALQAVTPGSGGADVFSEAGFHRLRAYAVPVIQQARRDDAAEERLPLTVVGAGTPGASIRLRQNGQALAPVTVDAQGQWSVATAVVLPSENTFIAELLTVEGQVLAESAAWPLIAHALLIQPPVVFDDLALDDGGRVAGTLTIRGSGAPNGSVTLRNGTRRLGEPADIAPDGSWVWRQRLPLPPGEQALTVSMSGPQGRALGEVGVSFRVPAPPTIAASGGESDVDDLLISGQAEAGAPVDLFVDDQLIATPVAGADGLWTQTTRLVAGTHRIHSRSLGLDSETLSLVVALTVPRIEGQNRDAAGRLLPGFYGTGRPNTELDIVQGNQVVGSALVGPDGNWRCTCRLAPGPHTLLVRETAEPVRASQPALIEVANPAPAYVVMADATAAPFRCPEDSPAGTIEGDHYIVGCGESLGLIAGRLSVTLAELLAFNPQLPDPPRVYNEQILNIPGPAQCHGP